MITWLFEKFPPRRLLKFIITGGIALAIDMVLYYMLTRYGHIHYLVSRALSLCVAIVWNFSINRLWTFRAVSGGVMNQASRFLTVIVLTSCLSLALMHVGVSSLHLNDLLVLIVISGFITLFNFTAHSLWSYAEREVSSGDKRNSAEEGILGRSE